MKEEEEEEDVEEAEEEVLRSGWKRYTHVDAFRTRSSSLSRRKSGTDILGSFWPSSRIYVPSCVGVPRRNDPPPSFFFPSPRYLLAITRGPLYILASNTEDDRIEWRILRKWNVSLDLNFFERELSRMWITVTGK